MLQAKQSCAGRIDPLGHQQAATYALGLIMLWGHRALVSGSSGPDPQPSFIGF